MVLKLNLSKAYDIENGLYIRLILIDVEFVRYSIGELDHVLPLVELCFDHVIKI